MLSCFLKIVQMPGPTTSTSTLLFSLLGWNSFFFFMDFHLDIFWLHEGELHPDQWEQEKETINSCNWKVCMCACVCVSIVFNVASSSYKLPQWWIASYLSIWFPKPSWLKQRTDSFSKLSIDRRACAQLMYPRVSNTSPPPPTISKYEIVKVLLNYDFLPKCPGLYFLLRWPTCCVLWPIGECKDHPVLGR